MKPIAILLAGLVLGTTSPAMADVWAPGRLTSAAAQGLQLAQNDDHRGRGKSNRDERSAPPREARGQREGGGQREVQQRQAQREVPQREAPQREPGRDPREAYGRQARPGYEARDPREAYGRPEVREAPPPQAYATPRLSEKSAIGAISRQFPGGRLLDSVPVMRNGRTYYSVRYLTRGGDRVDFLVDAETGGISRGGG